MPARPRTPQADPQDVLEDMRGRLGANTRAGRMRRGWTQEDAAWACGVSTRVFRDIEAGRATLRLDTIARLAAGLRVDPARLFRRVDRPAVAPQERPPGPPAD